MRMKEEFLPPMSVDTLWKHIMDRTQGTSRSIGLYIAVMTALFDSMPTTTSEPLRLQVLRRNIISFYQERLALVEIRTSSVESYNPPRASDLTLEHGLRYSLNSLEENDKSSRKPIGERRKTNVLDM